MTDEKKEWTVKRRETMIKKYGSLEKYQQIMREYGAKARRDTPRGLSMVPEKRRKEIAKMGAAARWKSHADKKDKPEA